jgi:hypothetical protein
MFYQLIHLTKDNSGVVLSRNGAHLFSNNSSDEVVVSKNLEWDFFRLAGVPRLLLHHLQDLRQVIKDFYRVLAK